MAQEEKDKTKEEEKTETEQVQESVAEEVVEESKEEKVKETDVKEEVKEEVLEEEPSEEIEIEGEDEVTPDIAGEERIPEFRVGDTIKVFYKIIEGDKVRTQPYQGIVIAKKGTGVSKTFTVRKIGADNIGVERIFPIESPNIEKIKLIKNGKVRRAKLYYLRGRVGRRATQIKEKVKVK